MMKCIRILDLGDSRGRRESAHPRTDLFLKQPPCNVQEAAREFPQVSYLASRWDFVSEMHPYESRIASVFHKSSEIFELVRLRDYSSSSLHEYTQDINSTNFGAPTLWAPDFVLRHR